MSTKYRIKLILVGESAVGKTSLIKKFSTGFFKADFKPTVGVDFFNVDVEPIPGKKATLNVWDIAGQENFKVIRSSFYEGASGALLIFDLTREYTYNKIKEWLQEVRKYCGENMPFILIGNKSDLITGKSPINQDEARILAENEGSIYIETSALTGDNVDKAFNELTRRIIEP